MKLDIFNPWRDLPVSWSGHTIQWQTSKKGNVFMTYLRDKESKAAVTSGHGRDKETSLERARANLNHIGLDGIKQAVTTGSPIHPSMAAEPDREVDWRDGANHRHRAQKRIVDRGFEDVAWGSTS